MHPPIPSPYAGADQPKVVYISTKTPFVSAVKRVRKLLALIEKRSMGKFDLIDGKGSDKEKLKSLNKALAAGKEKLQEEVLLKATGRAMTRALDIAKYFQGEEDVQVEFRDGSVSVVDDIIKVENSADRDKTEGQDEDCEDIPETRVRQVKMVEVAIKKK